MEFHTTANFTANGNKRWVCQLLTGPESLSLSPNLFQAKFPSLHAPYSISHVLKRTYLSEELVQSSPVSRAPVHSVP